MSDSLGLNQTRVLETKDRNFESITYQKRKPPLSSELDLGGKIDADRASGLTRFHVPSGFGVVGRILDAPSTMSLAAYEATLQAGDVVCSSSLVANSFRLIAKDYGRVSERNEAIVNGNRILVQGTNTADENNTIILNPPPTTGPRVDFVFLEVWRKLIYPIDSTIPKYGNVGALSSVPSDLVDPAMGIETSLRIQIQYRIRVVGSANSGIDIVGHPEGFDQNFPPTVAVQGPLGAPNNFCSHAYFSPVPGDVGLWIAGAGDLTEDVINTVDGYTYAIPMFAIRRRNSTAYRFNPSPNTNGAGHDLADYKVGIASDRPDNYYSDWIVAEDFVDLRHRVCAGENLKEICESTFRELVGNRNRGVMVKSGLNEYGTTRVQIDSVNETGFDPNAATHIAEGKGTRRIFSNAAMDQPETFFIVPKTGGPWAYNNTVQINLSAEYYPTGSTITSIGAIYNKIDGNLVSDFSWSSIPTEVLTLQLINPGSTLITNPGNRSIIVKCAISIPSSNHGLSQVPITFLQSMRNDSTCPQAMPDMDIRVRTSPPVIASDGTHFNMLRNRGGRLTDNWDFGHQMVYHALGSGSSVFSIPKTYEGYDIIGIGDIRVNNTDRTSPSVFWNMSTNNYDVTVYPAVALNANIECTLYTSGKFFTGNKQGRAITDTFEMALLTSDETTTVGNTFHIDGGNREILRIGSYISDNGFGFGYDKTGNYYTLQNHNSSFPLDLTGTYATVTFPISVQSPVYVPVMLRSAIDTSEGYSFFYKTVPYQGVLKDATTSITGHVEAVGPAITTSAGSGAITEFTYIGGQAQFNNTTLIDGTNTAWSSYVRPGYVIRPDADPTKEFLIKYVNSDTQIILDSPSYRAMGFENYTIVAKDQPAFNNANVIDIMPTLHSDNDSTAVSNPLAFFWQPSEYDALGERVLETRIISRVQDIADLPANSMWIGQNPANRGRSRVQLPADLAKLGRGNLGLKFEPMSDTSSLYYKKTYQSYILNKDNSGRLYLMVVGSETDNTSSFCFMNPASDRDVVDIFELSGRPILARRIA
jgi:hypothetical protein